LVGVLIGAVLAFGVAEGLSLLGGNGEIISAFLGEAPAVSPSPVREPVAPVAPPLTAPLAKPPAEPAPAVPEKPRAPVVAAREPVTPKRPPAPRGPATGTLIQDRLAAGGSGPEMVYVAGGVFRMGSAISQLASEEQPVHEVRLRSFSIGRYEVTFREYARFAAATGRELPDDLGWGQGPRPVINVSWNDARAYTDWLSEQTGQRYRLPSEAEWEYAAAAGTDTPYWWGFDLGSGNANCFNCGSEWDGATTAPVGRFAANPFGLHNTAGNVMEWVEDCYHGSYEGAPTDGSSWQEPGCRERVVRGGAFNKPGVSLRVTRRGRHQVDTRLLVVGFRVVREVR
jgi:formylglycine-generating enzyme required for sulfatase activity